MISNVPSTPTGSSEVQKLVRRFGTVIKTLVLNNMVKIVQLCNCISVSSNLSLLLLIFLLLCPLRSSARWRPQPWPCLCINVSRRFRASSTTTLCSSHAKPTQNPTHRLKSSTYSKIQLRCVTLRSGVL